MEGKRGEGRERGGGGEGGEGREGREREGRKRGEEGGGGGYYLKVSGLFGLASDGDSCVTEDDVLRKRFIS